MWSWLWLGFDVTASRMFEDKSGSRFGISGAQNFIPSNISELGDSLVPALDWINKIHSRSRVQRDQGIDDGFQFDQGHLVRLASETAPARVNGHGMTVNQPIAVRAAVEYALALLAIARPGEAIFWKIYLHGLDGLVMFAHRITISKITTPITAATKAQLATRAATFSGLASIDFWT